MCVRAYAYDWIRWCARMSFGLSTMFLLHITIVSCPKLQQIRNNNSAKCTWPNSMVYVPPYIPFHSVRHSALNIGSFIMLLHTICFYYSHTHSVCACVFRYEFHMFRLFISVNRPNLTFGSFIGFEVFFSSFESRTTICIYGCRCLSCCHAIQYEPTKRTFHFISCGTHILSACRNNNKTEWAHTAHTSNRNNENSPCRFLLLLQ